MMRRLFWVAAGAAAGILIARSLSRTARAFTPAGMSESIARSAAGIRALAREFVDDVLDAAAAKEHEMLAQLEHDQIELEVQRRAWADQAGPALREPDRPQTEQREQQ
jgi:gas vesicle protein